MEGQQPNQPTQLPLAHPYSTRPLSPEDQKKREEWLQAWRDLPPITLPPK
ncbi:hypothetical protein BNJ_00154 [Kaumoebavirus]|nr:hypothetical protein BNJ_00154 [Kaumoebavirus]ARA71986.1 hypothetical protein BNJ_00154 [Kaumoebavirus]